MVLSIFPPLKSRPDNRKRLVFSYPRRGRYLSVRRRRKLVHRERHFFKHRARILFVSGNTFLFGNAVLRCVYQVLPRSFYPYDREEAESHKQPLAAVTPVGKHTVNERAHIVGDLSDAAALAAAPVSLLCAYRKRDRIDRLDDDRRKVGSRNRRAEVTARAALENVDISLTAIEYDLLVANRNALEFLRSADIDTALAGDPDIEADKYLIESPVELNRLRVDVNADDFRRFDPYRRAARIR